MGTLTLLEPKIQQNRRDSANLSGLVLYLLQS